MRRETAACPLLYGGGQAAVFVIQEALPSESLFFAGWLEKRCMAGEGKSIEMLGKMK